VELRERGKGKRKRTSVISYSIRCDGRGYKTVY
jgi:hypothetical protein